MESRREKINEFLIKRIPAATGDEMADEDIALPSTLKTSPDCDSSTPVPVSSSRRRRRRRGRRTSAMDPVSTTTNGGGNSSALPADWQSIPTRSKGKEKAGPTNDSNDILQTVKDGRVQDVTFRPKNTIDLDLLDEGIRLLKWKDYSANFIFDRDELGSFDGFDDSSDYYDSRDMLHVNLGGSRRERGREPGGTSSDVFTANIYLDENEDLDSILLAMLKEEEKNKES